MSADAGDHAGWTHHEVYGVVLASERPISVLAPRPPAPPDLVVRRRAVTVDLSGWTWFRDWERDDGTVTFRAAHGPDGSYLIDFGVARFEIDGGGAEIRVWSADEADDRLVDVLFVDQVIPRVLAQRHELVFHGSAVEVGGAAIAFLGPSGRGKSTLAAHLGTRGHPVLSDDCLRFEQVDGGDGARLIVHPAYPAVRLWADSLQEVAPAARDLPVAGADPRKRRLSDPTEIAFATGPCPVGEVLFLAPSAASDGLRVEPLAGAAVIGELVGCQFLLDHTDEAEVRASFKAATLLGQSTRCARLHLPRNLDRLHQHVGELLCRLATGDA